MIHVRRLGIERLDPVAQCLEVAEQGVGRLSSLLAPGDLGGLRIALGLELLDVDEQRAPPLIESGHRDHPLTQSRLPPCQGRLHGRWRLTDQADVDHGSAVRQPGLESAVPAIPVDQELQRDVALGRVDGEDMELAVPRKGAGIRAEIRAGA